MACTSLTSHKAFVWFGYVSALIEFVWAVAARLLECIIDSQTKWHIANNLTRAFLSQGIIDYLSIIVTKNC